MCDKKTRLQYLDIAKGFGIILVVLGHSGISETAVKYIYSFHMPLFFIISGYLYKSEDSIGNFIKKKIKALYLPYVLVNLCGTVVYYLTFRDVLFYNGFAPFGISVAKVFLTLECNPLLFDPTWFLASLFQISIFYKVMDSSVKNAKYSSMVLLGCFFIFALLGSVYQFPGQLNYSLRNGIYFAFGVCLRRKEYLFERESSWIFSFVCLIASLGLEKSLIGHFATDTSLMIWLLKMVVAVFASMAVIGLCSSFEQKSFRIFGFLKETMLYLGKNTKSILIWHYFFFRIIVFIQMYMRQDDYSWRGNLLVYYPVYDSHGGRWLIYLFVGIIGPLAFAAAYRLGVDRMKNFMMRKKEKNLYN